MKILIFWAALAALWLMCLLVSAQEVSEELDDEIESKF